MNENWFTSKPYWLKGGIVGSVIAIASSILFSLCLLIFKAEAGLICFFLILPGALFFEMFLGELLFIFNVSELFYEILLNATNFILLLLAGLLLGWIVGKIKSKSTQL